MPVRTANASRAAAETPAASSRPVTSRAVTSRRAGRPVSTTRRSVARADRVWKYMATPARNAAAQPAVAVCTDTPIPPSSFAASAIGPAATSTNTTGTSTTTSMLTGLRR